MAREAKDDERTNAVGLFNTARSYWRSAEHLSVANLKVTHPQAPVTFLYCHAIELYLKAHLRGAGFDLAQLRKLGHNVASLARAAAETGLRLDSEDAEILSHIDDDEVAIESRYIVTGFKSIPSKEALSKVASQLDKEICSTLRQRGIGVRAEDFEPLSPAPEYISDEDSDRVLMHLFHANNQNDHDVKVIANFIGFHKGMLQYHLDNLAEAGLVENTGFNYSTGAVYWDLTPAGRRRAVAIKAEET